LRQLLIEGTKKTRRLCKQDSVNLHHINNDQNDTTKQEKEIFDNRAKLILFNA